MPSAKTGYEQLSRRERQLVDALAQLGRASAEELRAAIEDAPSNSAVRTTLKSLETKGQVRRERVGQRFEYLPAASAGSLRRSALRRLIDALFGGSRERAFAAMLEDCPPEDLARMEQLLGEAKRGPSR